MGASTGGHFKKTGHFLGSKSGHLLRLRARGVPRITDVAREQ